MLYERPLHHKFHIARFRDGDTVEGFLECNHCGSIRRDTIRIERIESWEPSGSTRSEARAVAGALTDRFRGACGTLTRNTIRRDNHGRITSDIIIGETAISLLIVSSGMAWWGVGEPKPENVNSPIHEVLRDP